MTKITSAAATIVGGDGHRRVGADVDVEGLAAGDHARMGAPARLGAEARRPHRHRRLVLQGGREQVGREDAAADVALTQDEHAPGGAQAPRQRVRPAAERLGLAGLDALDDAAPGRAEATDEPGPPAALAGTGRAAVVQPPIGLRPWPRRSGASGRWWRRTRPSSPAASRPASASGTGRRTDSASRPCTRNPCSPCVTTSGMPPTAADTMGLPHAIASTTLSGNPSCRDVLTYTSSES